LLAQPLLTLSPASPDLTPPGRLDVEVHADWGNDFGFENGPGGRARDLFYLLDGEHRSLAVTVRRGLGSRAMVGVRTGLQWRGGGALDPVIDRFHRLFGFPDSGRPLYPTGRLVVEGRHEDGAAIAWTGRAGTGLLPLEAEGAWRLGAEGRDTSAVRVRLRLPTATGAFRGSGGGIGAQWLAARGLGDRFDAFLGFGVTALGPEDVHGLRYRTRREQGFLALEWRPGRAVSLLGQLEGSSRLLASVRSYPGFQLALRLGAAIDVGRVRLRGGFVEGIKDLENTADFGVFFGVSRRF
ncbi:MAG TPA: DUF3187 family protein, partial [Vicinamibacteria bacterium]|nr:DUF3187 family protein [Vicinamibacteria bacterium]